jgi:hypothetical protein
MFVRLADTVAIRSPLDWNYAQAQFSTVVAGLVVRSAPATREKCSRTTLDRAFIISVSKRLG